MGPCEGEEEDGLTLLTRFTHTSGGQSGAGVGQSRIHFANERFDIRAVLAHDLNNTSDSMGKVKSVL
jgi:hypothetical protein